MKVLVIEYFTSGMCQQPPVASLVKEGMRMRDALSNDLQQIKETQVLVLHDRRLPPSSSAANVEIVKSNNNFIDQFIALLNSVDACFPIAPESDAVLEQICKMCEQQNKLLLNTGADAVKLSASKRQTLQVLQTAGINCVPTLPYASPIPFSGQVVIKTDDGIACQNLFIVYSNNHNKQMFDQRYIMQPYIQGQAASLSLLCFDGQALLLATNTQELRRRGQGLELRTCGVNMLSHDWQALEVLAQNIAEAMPGLAAYVGVDLIITEQEVLVLEINPRLTTSYIGLHRSIGVNPAQLVLDTLCQKRLPSIQLARHPVKVSVQ